MFSLTQQTFIGRELCGRAFKKLGIVVEQD
jgi:hypothetical protein